MTHVNMQIGSGAGKTLLDAIRGAKRRLVVVSPWLSRPSAELAVRKQEEGVDVEILTSNDPSPPHAAALGALIERRERVVRERRSLVQVAGAAFILTGLLSLVTTPGLNAIPIAAPLLVLGTFAIWMGTPRTERYWATKIGNLRVFDRSRLLHAKVYVMDDAVAVGSANFTVSGLLRSVEAVAFLKGDEIIGRVFSALDAIEEELAEIPLERLTTELLLKRRRR